MTGFIVTEMWICPICQRPNELEHELTPTIKDSQISLPCSHCHERSFIEHLINYNVIIDTEGDFSE